MRTPLILRNLTHTAKTSGGIFQACPVSEHSCVTGCGSVLQKNLVPMLLMEKQKNSANGVPIEYKCVAELSVLQCVAVCYKPHWELVACGKQT